MRHKHFCLNRRLGCESYDTCNAGYVEDDCGRHCADDYHSNRFEDRECLACEESRCADCGVLTRFEDHDIDCPQHLEPPPCPRP